MFLPLVITEISYSRAKVSKLIAISKAPIQSKKEAV